MVNSVWVSCCGSTVAHVPCVKPIIPGPAPEKRLRKQNDRAKWQSRHCIWYGWQVLLCSHEPEAVPSGAVGHRALHVCRTGRRAAVSWQCLHSHAPHTCTEGSGIWHKVPFQMRTGLRLLSSSLFKMRETCQNLSRGEEQIVIGENKWGKPEALDRSGEGGQGRTSSFHFFQRPEIHPHLSFVAELFLPLLLPPLLFPASSSDSFEITTKMDI